VTSWREQIDNEHFVEPSAIRGLANGSDQLKAVLSPIHDHDGNVVGLAAPVAARSYDAMVAAAWRDGVALRPSSSADTFRPLSVQQAIFTDRYRETDQGNGSRVCNGKRWYLRKGKATAACPGTSNHGKGCAVDFDLGQRGALPWLEAHAKAFGWQWEVTSEDWHLHYMLGDELTPVALAALSEEDDMPTAQEVAQAVWGLEIDLADGTKQPAWAVARFTQQDAHAAMVASAKAAGVDPDAIAKAVLAGLDPKAIAAAIPADIAAQVADELAARLKD
jgi:hypothetical protein